MNYAQCYAPAVKLGKILCEAHCNRGIDVTVDDDGAAAIGDCGLGGGSDANGADYRRYCDGQHRRDQKRATEPIVVVS
jgi:hypothetical protein